MNKELLLQDFAKHYNEGKIDKITKDDIELYLFTIEYPKEPTSIADIDIKHDKGIEI